MPETDGVAADELEGSRRAVVVVRFGAWALVDRSLIF